MQTELKPQFADSAGRAPSKAMDERSELALLTEFMRADSVAALAGHIAERLGADLRGDDLIAAAGLGGIATAGESAGPAPRRINRCAGLRR